VPRIDPVRDAAWRARRRVRAGVRTIVQTAIAVGLSWLIATEVLGYQLPFFAPIAAVITLGAASGAPARRALELAGGVALGIAIGDLLILGIGTGTIQIVVVVVLAMAVALLVGGSVLVVNQAAISAILVATLLPPTATLVPHRVFHAALGGGVAVLVGQVLLRSPPLPSVSRAARPVFEGLSAALLTCADALRRGDADDATRALLRARALDPQVRGLEQAHADAMSVAQLSIGRRGTRQVLRDQQDAVRQLDLAVRNTRVLARASITLLRTSPGEGEDDLATRRALADAVEELATGVDALGSQLTGDGPAERTRTNALDAARHAGELFPDRRSLALARIVGQVRATAVDLLRGSGVDLWNAQRMLEFRGHPSYRDAAPPDPEARVAERGVAGALIDEPGGDDATRPRSPG
jgi:uncharacterized membrane protein YgaE (UPF0421/DUF939 family)